MVQTLTEKVLRLDPPGGFFSDAVVRNLLPGQSVGARRAIIHRAARQGEVLRLKPGYYCLAAGLRRRHPHPFVVAGILHYPSQVSVESALAFWGLIPEAVHHVASVTRQRSRTFTTSLGRFEFRRVPCRTLRAGVRSTEVDRGAWAFVSTPLRAIADLVYLRSSVSWQHDGLGFVTESLRILPEDLEQLSFDTHDEICASLHSRRARRYLDGLRKELAR